MSAICTWPVIDGHAHIFERQLPLTPDRRYTPDRDATITDYLGELDRNGFSHGVLVQPSFLGTDNRYLLKALETFPRRLRGVVVVDRDITDEELARMAAAGVVGVRFNLVGLTAPDFRETRWLQFLSRLQAHGLHVELTCASAEFQTALPQLMDSGCQVVVDHFGRPDGPQGMDDPGFRCLLAAGSSGQVWVKLSAAYRMEIARFAGSEVVDRLANAFGLPRLIWGSDWPHTHFTNSMDFASAYRWLADVGLDAASRGQILGTSAQALFRIGGAHG